MYGTVAASPGGNRRDACLLRVSLPTSEKACVVPFAKTKKNRGLLLTKDMAESSAISHSATWQPMACNAASPKIGVFQHHPTLKVS